MSKEVDKMIFRDYASVFGKGNNYHYYIFSKGGFTEGLLQAQERGEVRLQINCPFLTCKSLPALSAELHLALVPEEVPL